MVTDEIRLPDIADLSLLSGLPEGIMANDMVQDIQKDMVRLGKPEKEAVALAQQLSDAFSKERERAVEACYMAGYLKGLADMAQRFRQLLEKRGELDGRGEHKK